MKQITVLIAIFFTSIVIGQKIDYNQKKGLALEGFDVVAYFDGGAKEGSSKYQYKHTNGLNYRFVSQKNLDTFKGNPKKYLPKYGGYCAYAMATAGKKVKPDPETYEIRGGELFVFYNSWTNNTLKSWLAESPEVLKPKADANWEKIKFK